MDSIGKNDVAFNLRNRKGLKIEKVTSYFTATHLAGFRGMSWLRTLSMLRSKQTIGKEL
jgi:hypothetical protein